MADNYIVRIYRYKKNKPASLVGLVEEVGVEGKRGFTSLEELWEILNLTRPGNSAAPNKEHYDRRRGKSLQPR